MVTNRYSFRYNTEEEFKAEFISAKSVLDMFGAELLSLKEYKGTSGMVCNITYRYEEKI